MICTCAVCGEILVSHHLAASTEDSGRAIAFRNMCAQIAAHINARHPELAQILMQLSCQHNCALVSKTATSTGEDFQTAQAKCIEAAVKTLTAPWEAAVRPPSQGDPHEPAGNGHRAPS